MSLLGKMFVLAVLALAGHTALAQPTPQPLPARQTVNVVIPAKLEAFAPVLVGRVLGEFEKENLEINYVFAAASEGLVLLATRRADIMGGAPTAGYFNAVAQGADIKMVGPGAFLRPDVKVGFWITRAFLAGRPYSPAMLKGQEILSGAGLGSSMSYTLNVELQKAGLSLKDVAFKQMGYPDIVPALENGSANVGFVVSPFWRRVDESKVMFAFTEPGTYSSAGWFYGGTLLHDKPAVGEAFMRGYVRTVRTHLQGNYEKDAKVAAALAGELGIPVETLTIPPLYPPDFPIPVGLMADMQKTYMLAPGILTYSEVLPDDKVLDRRFLDAALK